MRPVFEVFVLKLRTVLRRLNMLMVSCEPSDFVAELFPPSVHSL